MPSLRVSQVGNQFAEADTFLSEQLASGDKCVDVDASGGAAFKVVLLAVDGLSEADAVRFDDDKARALDESFERKLSRHVGRPFRVVGYSVVVHQGKTFCLVGFFVEFRRQEDSRRKHYGRFAVVVSSLGVEVVTPKARALCTVDNSELRLLLCGTQ